MGSHKAKKKPARKIKFGDRETSQRRHPFEAEESRPVDKTHLYFFLMSHISLTESHHFREMQASDYLLIMNYD